MSFQVRKIISSTGLGSHVKTLASKLGLPQASSSQYRAEMHLHKTPSQLNLAKRAHTAVDAQLTNCLKPKKRSS